MNRNKNEFLLSNPPSDGISRVFFSPIDPKLLIVSSWDKSVGIYNLEINSIVSKYSQNAAVLDCCMNEKNQVFSGGIDKSLVCFDIEKESKKHVGSHLKPISSVSFNPINLLVASGSWDGSVKFWDLRSKKEVKTVHTIGKVYSQDFTPDGKKLVVATHDRGIEIFSISISSQTSTISLSQKRKSPLLHQTRCIRNFNDNNGYVVSSTEGRVGVEFFDMSEEIQKKRYAFKCHRRKQNQIETLFPVNTIAFHPIGSFVTGGCDGKVISWDYRKRKRIKVFKTNFPTSIASLSYNREGNVLAIASSYTYELGEKEHPKDQVFLKNVDRSHFEYIK